MTKKHFEAFADEIASAYIAGQSLKEARFAAEIVCRIAQASNPRFDRERFLKACGLEK